MNIHLIKCTLFRDATKLRYTNDGRLLVKTGISKQLDISDKRNISCTIRSIDMEKKHLQLLFGTDSAGSSDQLVVSDIRGVKVLTLKSLVSRIAEVKEQYTSYEITGDGFLINLHCEALKVSA
jgi:hypothetical protein